MVQNGSDAWYNLIIYHARGGTIVWGCLIK
jgi:hypothetical protein